MSKETLTPWRYYPQFSEIVDSHGCRVALVGNKERAETILKVVNNHDRLVEALQEFCDRVEKGEVRSTKTYNKFKQLLTELKQQ